MEGGYKQEKWKREGSQRRGPIRVARRGGKTNTKGGPKGRARRGLGGPRQVPPDATAFSCLAAEIKFQVTHITMSPRVCVPCRSIGRERNGFATPANDWVRQLIF